MNPWDFAPRPPRSWQPPAFEAAIASVRAGENPLVSACTGAGKSDLIGALCLAAVSVGSVVVATPTQALTRQLAATIATWVGPERVGTYFADSKEIRPVTVVCNASLPEFPGVPNLRMLLSDEAHRSETDPFRAAVERLRPRAVVGLTATPFRSDARSLGLFSRCVFRYTLAEATRDGYLVPLRPRTWADDGTDAADVDAVCLRMIAGAEGPGVVSAVSIEDAESYAAYLAARGFPALAIHSLLPSGEGDRRIARLLAGEVRALVHVAMLVEGVDLPPLRWLAMRSPIGSVLRLVQSVGRILRASAGKTDAVVYDLHDTLHALGISAPDAIGLAEALDAAAEVEASGPALVPEPVVIPPAVAVSELERWAREAVAALVASGSASPRARGWRAGWASPSQLSALERLSSVGRWMPEGPRLAIRGAIDHGELLTTGQADDMIDLLLAASAARERAEKRHGSWPARTASIRKALRAIPEPPASAVDALRRVA